jgi:riboflavin synthase
MFTGIIETIGQVALVRLDGTNTDFWIESALAPELKVDQSVAHNGVCLTVVEIKDDRYRVTAVAETLAKTNLSEWKAGDEVNLERSLRVGDRLDGHFVQGHVDTTAVCMQRESLGGSWLFRFRFPRTFAPLVIEKADTFSVAIIPYTYEHTNFRHLDAGRDVNIEFDVLGKYLLRNRELQ